METVSLEEGLKTLRSWVFRRYYELVDCEDLFQEASVAYWLDHEKGEPVRNCFTSAKWRIKNLLSESSRATLTGQPKRLPGAMITKRGEETRQKVQSYITEYTRIHGKNPTVYRISKDTGISDGAVKNALKHVGVKDAATTPREPQMVYLVDITDAETDDSTKINAKNDLQRAIAVPSYESSALDWYMVKKFLLDLQPKDKIFLYLVYWENYSKSEAARRVGAATNRGYDIHKRIMENLIIKAIEMKYDEYSY